MKDDGNCMSITITTGIVASPGIRIGKTFVLGKRALKVPKYLIDEAFTEQEINRLIKAIDVTKKDLLVIQKHISISLSKEISDIFESHLMILDDPITQQRIKDLIINEKKNAEWAVNDFSKEFIENLNSDGDEYFRDRIIDIADLSKRIIANLQEKMDKLLPEIDEKIILFSRDLTPSEVATMNKELILAIVTDKGGPTSHTSIIARALEIPTIVGSNNCTSYVKTGDCVIVDAIEGKIIINPDEKTITEYKKHESDYIKLMEELAKLASLPSKTTDSAQINIFGNIEFPEEMKSIKDHGAQGIGLLRSEFLFIDKKLPDEETQFKSYSDIVKYFAPQPVTIRTLDVGGDKILGYTETNKEKNPFLGTRAIRFSLEHEEMFKVQLRAILKASHYGNVKLLFPLITCLSELNKAKKITYSVMDDLRKEGIPFNESIPIGIMIEVPSAAMKADILSKYCDFFSVGTNDLTQYMSAVDRVNEKLAYLYNPVDISVLRVLKMIKEAANAANIPVSICGEMTAKPEYTSLLLGLGYTDLSMSPVYMHQVKQIIRNVSMKESIEFTNELLQCYDNEVIQKKLKERYSQKIAEIK